jgi:hypothetical protein
MPKLARELRASAGSARWILVASPRPLNVHRHFL